MKRSREEIERIVDDRWNQAMVRPARFRGEFGYGTDLSKRYVRLTTTMAELGAILAGGDVSDYERAGQPSDWATLDDLIERDLMEYISKALASWAVARVADDLNVAVEAVPA